MDYFPVSERLSAEGTRLFAAKTCRLRTFPHAARFPVIRQMQSRTCRFKKEKLCAIFTIRGILALSCLAAHKKELAWLAGMF